MIWWAKQDLSKWLGRKESGGDVPRKMRTRGDLGTLRKVHPCMHSVASVTDRVYHTAMSSARVETREDAGL